MRLRSPQPGQPYLKFEVDQGYDMNIVQYYTKLVLYNINHTHTHRHIVVKEVTPLIPHIKEESKDDGEIHHDDEDDDDHAGVHRDPHDHHPLP